MRSAEGFAAILAALIKGDQQAVYANLDRLSPQELETLDHAALQLSKACQIQKAAQMAEARRKAEK